MTDHPLTLDALEEGHSLLLGQTRSGKTYQLRGILERLRRADRRVGAIDKLGNHWGLTLSADGQRPGLDFVIFGGKRGHVPMTPADGATLGRLFVERNVPAIFDVSQWHHDEQQAWVADFADAVFLHNEGALHLALDEAPSWIPQQNERGDAYRPVQRLATQGLGNGIRLIMASQRWSMIDKTSAGMASLVVTMRQFGSADRKAMRELLPAEPAEVARMEKELASLPAGTGYVWDPRTATLERHAFPPNSTFDSSRTPKHGDTPPPPIAVSSELVEELRAALAPAIDVEPVKKNSESLHPDVLAFENARLRESIERLNDDVARLNEELELSATTIERWQALIHRVHRDIENVLGWSGSPNSIWTREIESQAKAGADAPPPDLGGEEPVSRPVAGRSATTTSEMMDVTAGETAPPVRRRSRAAPVAASGEPPPLNKTALEAAALLRGQGAGMAWNNVLLALGRRPNSGDSRAARKALIEHELIYSTAGLVSPTSVLLDRDDIGFGHWPGAEELVELWAAKLRGPGAEMLRSLFEGGPIDPAGLARRLAKSPTSGWWRQGLKDLRGSNLVRDEGGLLRLHPFLEWDDGE